MTGNILYLHVRSVLCHLRPDRAYLFLLLLLLRMSSLPTISGREHLGVDMSLRVSWSGREEHHIVCNQEQITGSLRPTSKIF